MNGTGKHPGPATRGILIRGNELSDAQAACRMALARLAVPDLIRHVLAEPDNDAQGPYLRLRLDASSTQAWAPGFDTIHLAETLQLRSMDSDHDLQRESC
jgi:hypothetical protein